MAMGDPNAPITVVMYGDYQCTNCALFARQNLNMLISQYVATGRIRLEFHQNPMLGLVNGEFDQTGESFVAAEAALCANDQNLFWPYHQTLYANTVGFEKKSFTSDRLKALAATVPGMDLDEFNSCLDSGKFTAQVRALADQAQSSGIGSDLTFIVNGQPVTGNNYTELTQAIEQQIAGP